MKCVKRGDADLIPNTFLSSNLFRQLVIDCSSALRLGRGRVVVVVVGAFDVAAIDNGSRCKINERAGKVPEFD